MGWGDCGTDSKGRQIGYNFTARCDHAGCKTKIDRGLAYACGGMHGENGYDCEGYFCGEHMVHRHCPDDERAHQVCLKCAATLDEHKMEELIDVLVMVGDLPDDDDPESAVVKLKQAAYEVLLSWDEGSALKPDQRFMSEEVLVQRRRIIALFHGSAAGL